MNTMRSRRVVTRASIAAAVGVAVVLAPSAASAVTGTRAVSTTGPQVVSTSHLPAVPRAAQPLVVAASTRPTVSGLSPVAGALGGGTVVTIVGTQLSRTRTVLFGGVAGKHLVVVSAKKLRVTAPPHAAGAVAVRVVVSGVKTPVAAGRYTYQAPPVVTRLSRTTGPVAAGDTVWIWGSHLERATRVWFGTTSVKVLYASAGEVIVASPPHAAGAVYLRVVTPGGTSPVVAAGRYTYRATPPADHQGGIRLASVGPDGWGVEAEDVSPPQISDDGRYVVLRTVNDNWAGVNGDTYLRDLTTGSMVSLTSSAATAGKARAGFVLSRNGHQLGYAEQGPAGWHLYVMDVTTSTVSAAVDVKAAGGLSAGAATVMQVSDDGRWVLFSSDAHDLVTGVGDANPHLYLRDLVSATTTHVAACSAFCWGARMTPSGSHVAYMQDDVAHVGQVYLWSRVAATSVLISAAPGGAGGTGASYLPSVSDDATTVAYSSSATNLLAAPVTGSHAYLRDLTAGTTVLLDRTPAGAVADGDVFEVDLAGGGSRVALTSSATNLTGAPVHSPFRQLYVRDLATGATRLTSRTAAGGPGNGYADTPSNTGSWGPALTGDGALVVFASQSTDLVPAAPSWSNVYVAQAG